MSGDESVEDLYLRRRQHLDDKHDPRLKAGWLCVDVWMLCVGVVCGGWVCGVGQWRPQDSGQGGKVLP